jgi:hypothetical protein
MRIQFDRRMAKRIASRYERYEFEAGILEDKPYREPEEHGLFEEPQLGNYAGGPVRKATRTQSDKSIGDIFVDNMRRINTNLLWEPFKSKGNQDLRKFSRAFFQFAFGRASENQVKNLLQAIIRNPILKGAYGTNKPGTADAKGFDRHLIDTAQTFKAIRARVKTRSGRV